MSNASYSPDSEEVALVFNPEKAKVVFLFVSFNLMIVCQIMQHVNSVQFNHPSLLSWLTCLCYSLRN